MTRRGRVAAVRAALFILGALAFSSAVGNRLEAPDDERIILEQPFLRAVTLRNLVTCAWPLPVREEWLPARDLTLMADFAAHGGRPEGFVLTNLLLHGAVVAAVHGLLRRVLAGVRRRELAAACGAVVFAVHPMHLESVAWASGRKDSLCALLVVLAVGRWLDAARARDGAAAARRRLAATALGLAALLSKATAVCLPLLLLAADLLVARARPATPRAWAARLLALAPLTVAAGLFARGYPALLAAYARATGDVVVKQHPGWPPATILFTDGPVFAQYLGRFLLPVDLRPFSDQGYRTALDAEVALGLAVCVAAAVAGALLARARPALAYLVAWVLVALVPVANLVPHGIPYAERYTHLASVGGCGLLGAGLAAVGARLGGRRGAALLLAPLVGLATFACLREARAFASAEALWTRVLAREPGNAMALANLGGALLERDPRRAEGLLVAALARDPARHQAAYHLGLLAEREGRLDEALERYRQAARIRPMHVSSLLGAASVLAKQGRWELAVALDEEVMRRFPGAGARAAWNRAATLEGAGQRAAARAAWLDYLAAYGWRPEEAAWAAEARSRASR